MHRRTSLEPRLRIGLCFSVLGAVVLPLIPIWTGLVTAIGIAWVLMRNDPGNRRTGLSVLLLVPHGLYLAGWIAGAITDPLQFFVSGLMRPHGQPIGVFFNSMQLTGQIALVLALVWQAWGARGRGIRAFLAACAGFAIWTAFACIWNIGAGVSDNPAIILAGSAVWASWAVIAILGALIFGEHLQRGFQLLPALSFAAGLLATAIVVQWALGDFSYVLVTYGSDEIFSRVRGSYYYHAPATQCVVFLSPLVLLSFMRHRNVLEVAAILLIVAVLWLNDTRAISLATVFGFGGYAALLILTGRIASTTTAVAMLIAVIASTQVFYVKPGVKGTEFGRSSVAVGPLVQSSQPAGGGAEPSQPGGVGAWSKDESTGLNAVLVSNSLRGELALAGINIALQRPISGFGPGNGRIVLAGNLTNQKRFEISSHTLAIDLAMMGGVPALIGFIVIFAIPTLAAFGTVITRPTSDRAGISIGLVCALTIFAISSFFHPQEQSYIIAIAMLLAGVLAGNNLRNVYEPDRELKPARDRHIEAAGTGLLAAALAGWLLVTSPSYVFPAVEFLARYRSDLRDDDLPVYTTNAVLNRVLGWGMALIGIEKRPRVLPDDPGLLPTERGFIIWGPADEGDYPELQAALGPAEKRRYGQWMSVDLLPAWTLVNNYQPHVQFIRVGAFPNIEVNLNRPEGQSFGPRRDTTVRIVPKDILDVHTIYLRLEGSSSGSVNISWSTGNNQVTRSAFIGEKITLTAPVEENEINVSVTQADAVGILRASALISTMPSVTHLADGHMTVGGREDSRAAPHLLMDLSDQSAASWKESELAVLELDFAEPFVLAAYQIVPQIEGPTELPAPLEWRLEGRTLDGQIVVIDRQDMTNSPAYDVGFAVKRAERAQYYRFVFPVRNTARTISIRELRMHPKADGFSPIAHSDE